MKIDDMQLLAFLVVLLLFFFLFLSLILDFALVAIEIHLSVALMVNFL